MGGSTGCRTPTRRAAGSPTPSRNPMEKPTTFAIRSRWSSMPTMGRRRSTWQMPPIRSSRPTGASFLRCSSLRCSSRSMRCRRICRSTSATTLRTCFTFRLCNTAYHMTVLEVFYNREDLLQFPREPTGPDGANSARMAPYYIMTRLPGDPHAEFFLMLPMVPSQRENMIAWLAARCDPPDYGKLIVYEFPKEKLVCGPFQIEARINQNTEISQQISLWNQMGSRVIRGNLLVVPIENSILYVSPLYLRAQSGQLPELKRVIAAYGDRVVMEETLPAALAALFKESAPLAGLPALAGPSAASPADARAREALGHYDRAIDRLKAGDWAGFGAELDALRPLLEELGRQPAVR